MSDVIHLDSLRGGAPVCRDRDPVARLTADPEMVTCSKCRAKPTYATRMTWRASQRKRDSRKKKAIQEPRFASEAEREWFDGRRISNPTDQTLAAIIRQEDVTLTRLRFAYRVSGGGSKTRELLGVRLRQWLGLPDGAPLEREAAHG